MTQRKRIIVADDDELLRKATCDVLADAGYEVVGAENGEELLRSYRDGSAALVLCDLFMPEKDGLEVIGQLRREFPNAKVIAMSGGAYDRGLDLLKVARQLGAVETIAKPFKRAVLLELVARVLAAF
jgi:CheY-like chemotaxis protein